MKRQANERRSVPARRVPGQKKKKKKWNRCQTGDRRTSLKVPGARRVNHGSAREELPRRFMAEGELLNGTFLGKHGCASLIGARIAALAMRKALAARQMSKPGTPPTPDKAASDPTSATTVLRTRPSTSNRAPVLSKCTRPD